MALAQQRRVVRRRSRKLWIAMLSGNISESSRPPASSTWYRPSLPSPRRAARGTSRRARTAASAGTRRATSCSAPLCASARCHWNPTLSGSSKREVRAEHRRSSPSGARARSPCGAEPHEDERDRDHEHPRPERAEEVHEPVAGARVGVVRATRTRATPRAARSRTTARTSAGARGGRARTYRRPAPRGAPIGQDDRGVGRLPEADEDRGR